MEVVCDTNIFYRYGSMFRSRKNVYLPSYYNFEDLIASKKNIKRINQRLKTTLRTKLKSINNHELLIFEPHYYIISELFPNSNYGRKLFERLDETNPNSYISMLSSIIVHGESVRPEIKEAIKVYAEKSKILKNENNQEAVKFAKRLYKLIGYDNKTQVNYLDFIPYIEDLFIGQLNAYRTEMMINTSHINKSDIDLNKHELFIKTYSKYIADMVSKEGQNPARNDNIDSLILMYVTKGRKFMGCEKKWLNLIKDVGLHKEYIEPYSKSRFGNIINKMCLKLCGKVIFKECK